MIGSRFFLKRQQVTRHTKFSSSLSVCVDVVDVHELVEAVEFRRRSSLGDGLGMRVRGEIFEGELAKAADRRVGR